MADAGDNINNPETIEREYPSRPIASTAAYVFRDGKILLAKRGNQPGKGLWSVPGGAIELGETVHQAARREVREECNIEIQVEKLFNVVDVIMPGENERIKFHYVIIYLLARYLGGEPTPGSDALAVCWASYRELDNLNMIPVIRKNIKQAFDTAQESSLI